MKEAGDTWNDLVWGNDVIKELFSEIAGVQGYLKRPKQTNKQTNAKPSVPAPATLREINERKGTQANRM